MRGKDKILRDWLLGEFDYLRARLLEAKEVLEVLDKDGQLGQLEVMKYQMAALSEGLQECERRLLIIERHNSTVNWLARQIGTILVIASALYMMRSFLGY